MIVIAGDPNQGQDINREVHSANAASGAKAPVLNVAIEGIAETSDDGISNLRNNLSRVFPNPSNGEFSITVPGGEILGYRIFNLNGRIISELPDRYQGSGKRYVFYRKQNQHGNIHRKNNYPAVMVNKSLSIYRACERK